MVTVELCALLEERESSHNHRERKCADTIGTVLVPWAGHFNAKYKYIFQIKCTKAILSNSTRKLLWFEITEMLTAVKNNFSVSFIIIFGTLSFSMHRVTVT